ncbi:hypothetical protein [Micromonospora sp. NBC_01796]|uniref:hypothetical protein n=1 Tax=Micromonospora sp. NBC_01796 TaxID=2975987 RepID=UPI002DD9DF73|nr:hypothetical protein [Micromonospora sp. NBC_01796]WSA84802.1 hypothetical protein OIE47_31305 [Micromonospora sp. NBC_01796]
MDRARVWWRVGDRVRRQRRAYTRGGLLLLVSAAMLLGAWRTRGFASDLLLNLGASVVLAAISYVIFDPLFEEARKARVQEHVSFDQKAFIDVLARTGRRVRILDTWTILLELGHREQTLRAVRAALEQGALIQVLLLDPDCAAAQQRTEELEKQHVNVPRRIKENLRHLYSFWASLEGHLRSRLQIHIYDASPSIQLYQWDGQALISFFPIGKLSFNVPQLEVDMASPWGEFVHARFEELWGHHQATLNLERYWAAPMTLRHADSDMAKNRVPYALVDGQVYVDCRTFHLTRDSIGTLTVRTPLPPRANGSGPGEFTLVEVREEDPTPLSLVRRRFQDKYGASPDRPDEGMLVRLVPSGGDPTDPPPPAPMG